MTALEQRAGRVLVTLDADPDSLDLLEHAADLAHAIDAELACLFVEDENLLRLSELPGAEIVFTTGGTRRTSLREMERQLKARAAEARQRLERVATHRQIAWSFEVRRCVWSQAIAEATQSARVVAMGRSGRGPARGYGLAPRRQAEAPVRAQPRGVAVLYEAGEGAAGVLELARRAAATLALPLSVLIPARTAEAAASRSEEVRRQCTDLPVPLSLVRLPATRAALLRRLKEQRPHFLLLDAAGPLAGSGTLRQVVDAADCRVMLISRP